MSVGILRASRKLIGKRELIHRDLILVRVTCPCSIHQRYGFVLFVLFQDGEGPRVQLGIFPAGIERCHPANRQQSVFVTNFRHQQTEILKECHVVRNRIAVWQNPLGIFEIEMDQARHVVPAAQIKRQDVIAKVVRKLLHLIRERMRFNERHALDRILRPAFCLRDCLEQVAPPERFLGRFGFRHVERQRMF